MAGEADVTAASQGTLLPINGQEGLKQFLQKDDTYMVGLGNVIGQLLVGAAAAFPTLGLIAGLLVFGVVFVRKSGLKEKQ